MFALRRCRNRRRKRESQRKLALTRASKLLVRSSNQVRELLSPLLPVSEAVARARLLERSRPSNTGEGMKLQNLKQGSVAVMTIHTD